jgi:hypothetical protein
MTAPALVKSSDLRRLATIAKREGVRVEMETDGTNIRISISPDNQDESKHLAPKGGVRL